MKQWLEDQLLRCSMTPNPGSPLHRQQNSTPGYCETSRTKWCQWHGYHVKPSWILLLALAWHSFAWSNQTVVRIVPQLQNVCWFTECIRTIFSCQTTLGSQTTEGTKLVAKRTMRMSTSTSYFLSGKCINQAKFKRLRLVSILCAINQSIYQILTGLISIILQCLLDLSTGFNHNIESILVLVMLNKSSRIPISQLILFATWKAIAAISSPWMLATGQAAITPGWLHMQPNIQYEPLVVNQH